MSGELRGGHPVSFEAPLDLRLGPCAIKSAGALGDLQEFPNRLASFGPKALPSFTDLEARLLPTVESSPKSLAPSFPWRRIPRPSQSATIWFPTSSSFERRADFGDRLRPKSSSPSLRKVTASGEPCQRLG